MLPLRIVCPLAMFMILTSGASGQEVDDASFGNLAKQCQMRASVAASSRAIKIRDEAIAQHQAFNGSRVDRAGRIVFFGHSEAESDQEIDGDVSARQIPWRQVLGYWEKLNDRKIGEGAGVRSKCGTIPVLLVTTRHPFSIGKKFSYGVS